MKPNALKPVTARIEPMVIPTYPALAPEPNPMFFETRNVQGSKGAIYPHPFIDQISSQKVDQTYQAIVLENEYIQMVMLPELGGRIFTGLDKTNQYDFFYRHQVIKPALIGTFGPWISGGVEFNWPQHHRPTTFDPTDFLIEEHADGSKTAWMGEHEPLNRTKGMVGITLYPGKAYVETKVRLFNRTPFPQTFLWWANAGVPINDKYQVIFPPDVHYAVYHSKNPVIEFPIGKGPFLGNDYGEGTDISYWANSPGASSFFAAESKYEFFGGYDHTREAGVVHVADAGISGGKKYFTWANGPFGHQWQKNLYDNDEEGEYLELMAGVYTDNQPDFSWIMPYETRTFSQFWFPVQKIGGIKNANLRAAVNLDVKDGLASLGACALEVFNNACLTLSAGGKELLEAKIDLYPGQPFTADIPLPGDLVETDLLLRITAEEGEEIIRYQPEGAWDGKMPEPYRAPAEPKDMETTEDLFLTGLHLEQYRHPGIAPEAYWQEALRRDPGDARCNQAMGKIQLRRGSFSAAEDYFQKAVSRLTSRNFNPYDGEPHYNLGLSLAYQGRLDQAYRAFYKATWNFAWQSASFYSLAQIDLTRKNYTQALEHLERSLQTNTQNAKSRALKAAVLRRTGQADAARTLTAESIQMDPLDFWARFEYALADPYHTTAHLEAMTHLMRGEAQTYLDIALDYAMSGLDDEAVRLLEIAAGFNPLHPMVGYTLSFLAQRMGDSPLAVEWQKKAAAAQPDYCFPWRLEEMIVLQNALKANPGDARAAYYLGNLYYDKKRYGEAVALWKQSTGLDGSFSIAWRNLGLAAYNQDKDLDQALVYFEKAVTANPGDPRLLLERDFLQRRKAIDPQERLARLLSRPDVVAKRDDLMMELMVLYNRTGQPEKALEVSRSRSFHPWEGGEGSVSGEYASACWLLGRKDLEAGDAGGALKHFQAGLASQPHLGELPGEDDIIRLEYYSGLAHAALGDPEKAKALFEKTQSARSWGLSAVDYYKAMAQIQLGHKSEGQAMLIDLKKRVAQLAESGIKPNYFYYGNPNPTFEEDPIKAQRLFFTLLGGLACLGLGDLAGAKNTLGHVLAVDPENLTAFEELKRLP